MGRHLLSSSIAETSFEQRLEAGDVELFGTIRAQLGNRDKRSLLALHAAVREASGGSFTYLEIGSYLGGSLQAVLADPGCRRVISIDPRPGSVPDDRGRPSEYGRVTADTMRRNLERVPGADLSKLVCVDASTADLDPGSLDRPQLCFVDGEHTAGAALRDARFCRRALQEEGCVVFHDAHVVFRGIKRFVDELGSDGVPFAAYVLPSALFVVELGPFVLRDRPTVRPLFEDGWRAYVYGLGDSDRYRLIANRRLVRILRRLRVIRD